MTSSEQALIKQIEKVSYKSPILFYDGVCGLCNGFVSMMIRHDKKAIFKYSSLQENEGKIISKHLQLGDSLDTVIALDNGQYYQESDVLLLISRRLRGWWLIFRVLSIIPLPLRNRIYRAVAKYRYQIAGRREVCTFIAPSRRLNLI